MKARLSTALLFVAVFAVQFAWLRPVIKTKDSLVGLDAPAFDVGFIFPSTLLFAFSWLSNPGRFKRGFQAGGLVWVGLFYIVARYRGGWVRLYLDSPIQQVASFVKTSSHGTIVIYVMDTILFLLPFMVWALAGGFLTTEVARRTN